MTMLLKFQLWFCVKFQPMCLERKRLVSAELNQETENPPVFKLSGDLWFADREPPLQDLKRTDLDSGS